MGKKATILLAHILFQAATIFVAVITITAWFAGVVPPDRSWVIAFFSLGMLPLLVVNLVFAVIWVSKRSFWAVLPALAILVNIGFVNAMFGIDFRSEDKLPKTDLTIATYNIHGYVHADFNGTLVDIVKYMEAEGVDVLCMQEFIDKPAPELDSLLAYFPYRIVHSDKPSMQLAVFSRYPVTETRVMLFDESQNCAMWADVEVGGEKIRVFNVHFQTTEISQSHAEIERLKRLGIRDPDGKDAFDVIMDRLKKNAFKRAEQVMVMCSEIKNSDRPNIVCGDFNDTPASFAYHQIKKGLVDGFKSCGSGYGYTFKPIYHLFRLDYIFYSDRFDGVSYYSQKKEWSDHNPVILKLSHKTN